MKTWNIVDDVTLVSFARGLISGRNFYNLFKNTENGGQIRNLLRSYGVDRARDCARMALARRKKQEVKTL